MPGPLAVLRHMPLARRVRSPSCSRSSNREYSLRGRRSVTTRGWTASQGHHRQDQWNARFTPPRSPSMRCTVEDQLCALAAVVQCLFGTLLGAVPLLLESLREPDQLRTPRDRWRKGGDVLPVRAALAEVQDPGAVAGHEHGVVPGADGLAVAAFGRELRRVTLPLVRAARERVVVTRGAQRRAGAQRPRIAAARAPDHLGGQDVMPSRHATTRMTTRHARVARRVAAAGESLQPPIGPRFSDPANIRHRADYALISALSGHGRRTSPPRQARAALRPRPAQHFRIGRCTGGVRGGACSSMVRSMRSTARGRLAGLAMADGGVVDVKVREGRRRRCL